jgi:dephospho-CoA kinase
MTERGKTPVIGLIGGIGSGKSRVAGLLAQRGAVVINADQVGHQVLEEPEIMSRVVARFGSAILRSTQPNGSAKGPVDRRALGSVVFADRAALRDLEAIVHPVMRERIQGLIERERQRGQAQAIVLDAAILLEAGWDDLCDLVVFVDASWPVRLERVSRSRGWTAEVLRAREAAQWPCQTKKNRAGLVLENEKGLESLEEQSERLFQLVLAGQTNDRSPQKLPERVSEPAPGPCEAVVGKRADSGAGAS